MNFINSILYNKEFLYDTFYRENNEFRIYFQKKYCRANNATQYFLKLYIMKESVTKFCLGYIYFYLNEETKTSSFIGVYMKPEFRNLGFASLLLSHWIQFCLNNRYIVLETNKRQRKPFLIYLLKTYGFDLINTEIYKTNPNVIDVCRKEKDMQKYLLFNNPIEKENFSKGKIFQEDNYCIIETIVEDMHYLDSVILSEKYYLKNEFIANKKSTLVLKRDK